VNHITLTKAELKKSMELSLVDDLRRLCIGYRMNSGVKYDACVKGFLRAILRTKQLL
jgi:hypothetical protein